MCVVLSLSLPHREFRFGRIVSTDADVRVQLAKVVPGYQAPFTLFWVHGDERERFESRVRSHDDVDRLRRVCENEESVQYVLQWNHQADEFAAITAETEAVVLDGSGDGDRWRFSLRFPDQDALLDFHDRCRERGIDFEVVQIESDPDCAYPTTNLTEEQREALLLALDEGYFDIPKRTTLTELGEELGISQQAVSQRLNRAIRNCLHDYLHLPST